MIGELGSYPPETPTTIGFATGVDVVFTIGFCTFIMTLVVAMFPEESVESPMSVVLPLASAVVFHDTEYRVPDGIAKEPINVDVLPA
jgi:hypothetical protein